MTHLESHTDNRGKFVELVREEDGAYQISFSTSKPGVTRGDHYHERKTETFFVVSGEATIRLRKINTHDVTEIQVSGTNTVAVPIPPGTVHNITNTGTSDMCLVLWASEPYDENDPDTKSERVEIDKGFDGTRNSPRNHTDLADLSEVG